MRSEVKWVRNYDAPISAEELDFVDYVFCTHAHFDHADPDTLSTLVKINKKAKYITPAPVADILKEYGVQEEDIIRARDAEKVNAKLFVPMHFDLYDCNCISVTSFVDAHKTVKSKVPFHIFQPGEKYIWG